MILGTSQVQAGSRDSHLGLRFSGSGPARTSSHCVRPHQYGPLKP